MGSAAQTFIGSHTAPSYKTSPSVFASILLAFTLTSGTAWAQAPPGGIAGQVRMGQKVSITDTNGREVKGRVTNVAQESVTIGEGSKRTDVPYADILRIDRLDDLKNGAMVGLVVGAALFVLDASLAASDGLELNPAGYVVFGAIYCGLGAGAGAGIDALIGGNRTIYRRGENARLSVLPTVRHDRAGIRLVYSW